MRSILCCALLAMLPALGRAQDASAARALFERGQAAAAQGRFPEARDHYLRSLELAPISATAFNLAIAHRGMGDSLAALAIFDRLLDDEFGPLSAAQSEEVQRLRAEVVADLAVVSIRVCGAPDPTVRLDGAPVDIPTPCEVTHERVNAGRHVVTASAPNALPAERAVRVGSSETVAVDLMLRPLESSDDGWLWAVIPLAVVAVSAAIAIPIAVDVSSPDRVTDPVFGEVMALGVAF